MKKFVSVLLACIMALSVFTVAVSAKTSEEVDRHLQYNEDGSFRVMQFADLQDGYPMKVITKRLIRKALDTLQPDLIILSGDNISSTSLSKFQARMSIKEFMSIFEEYGIPVAAVFGNHDDENTPATKAYQMSCYEKYSCFIGCAGEDLGSTNLGTYYVPIYSSTDSEKMVSNIWMVDSGTYNTENDLGGYAATTKAQIEWYASKSAELEEKNGAKIPSLMFQHIVVPEIWDALVESDTYTDGAVSHGGKYYTLPDGTVGALGETPCPPNYNNGEFAAVKERGDVMAMFFGHDHVNSYELEYEGVGLYNTAGVGFKSYNSENVGVRVIDLNENDPWSFETKSHTYFDLFDFDDDVARYLYKTESRTTSDSTKFASFFKLIFAWIKSVVTGGK